MIYKIISNKVTHLLGALMILSLSQLALADCVYRGSIAGYVNFGNVIVQRDTPIGTTIAQATYQSPAGTDLLYCTTPNNISYTSLSYFGAQPTSISHVYKTNISGVGIMMQDSGGVYYESYMSGGTFPNGFWFQSGRAYYLSLIKTGPITSGALQTGLIGARYPTNMSSAVVSVNLSGGTVTQVACSITTPNVNVPLDPVLAASFTGVNSTKGDTPFTIGLECDAGARINASLNFTQNTSTSDNSVIQLTGAGTAGVASGVGIQLLYGGSILRNNTNVVLKTSVGGSEFPAGAFTARYFQTAGTVTPGDANATATLNLTYQ